MAQNLVPNPSFEDNNSCPSGISAIGFSPTYSYFPTVQAWINPFQYTSPDYFNACAAASSGVHVPEANFGYQRARTGDAYTGIIAWEESKVSGNLYHFGEYLECKLISPMIAGRKYCVSFYVSSTITSALQFNYIGIDEVGAHFSTSQISQTAGNDLSLPYHIVSPANNFIVDTNAWIKVAGVYTATGNEEWMTIGRFNTAGSAPNSTLVYPGAPNPSLAYRSYMYIDDVGVYLIGPTDTSRLTTDKTYCDKSAIPMTLTSRGINGTFSWNTGQTTQQITVTNDSVYICRSVSGCQVFIDTFLVKYEPDLILNLGGELVSCDNQPIVITPKHLYSSYTWNTGSHTPSITASTPGKYWLTVNSPCGIFTDTVDVYIQSRPPVPIVKDTALCQLSVNPKLSNVKGQNIHWYTNPISLIGSPVQPFVYTKDVGKYVFYVTQQIGKCESDKVMVNIDIRYQPKHELEDKYTMCAHKPDIIGSLYANVSYFWSNGSRSCCVKPDHEGLYKVTTLNECGTYTDSTRIYLSPCDSCITVPNAFTPNGDGMNDKFYAIYKCPITNFHMSVYNRWGVVLYDSQDVKQSWPGTISGQYVEQGVYVYIIEYTPESTGIPNRLKGNITVLR